MCVIRAAHDLQGKLNMSRLTKWASPGAGQAVAPAGTLRVGGARGNQSVARVGAGGLLACSSKRAGCGGGCAMEALARNLASCLAPPLV